MGLRSNLAYLMKGPQAGSRVSASVSSAQIIPFPVERPSHPQSWSATWDTHIVSEAAGFSSGKAPQTISVAWDERDQWGLDLASRSWQGVTPQERKEILLGVYINVPAVSSCVDVITKRICSGGFTIEKIDEEAPDNTAQYDQLAKFLDVNDDWNFLQFARASMTDELIYGESYAETLFNQGLPSRLVKVDCVTMNFIANKFGQIEDFYQLMPSSGKKNYLQHPERIIRWWFPHPRASIDPFAPAEKVSDATLLSKKMVNWMITFFQKGAKFPYYIKFPGAENEADRFKTWFDQNVTGEKNAHRPPIVWGSAEIVPLGNQGALDMDFQKGEDRQDIIIYGAYGVPPMAVSVVKTGALGGSIGEDEDKAFIFNACDPVKHQWLEQLNYRIVKKGFGITDYKIGLRYADYRSDQAVAQVQDIRIKNGTRTIDETRQEDGKRPYKVGGDVAVIVTTKEITPVPRLGDIEDEQRQTAQVTLDTQKAQLEKIKNPPPPPPALQHGQPGQAQQQQAKQPQMPAQEPANKTANKITGKTTKQESVNRWVFYQEAMELTDRYQALGIPYPNPETMCSGECEGTGYVPVHKNEQEEPWHTLWLQAEKENPNEPGDDWHFVKCPDCNGTGKKQQAKQESSQQHNTGMMLAFLLDTKTASQLAIPDGEPASELHITLAYLGDMEDEPVDDGRIRAHLDPFKIADAIAGVVSQCAPMHGTIQGLGRFNAPEGKPSPVYASPDVPGLAEFRTKLVTAVEAAGYYVAHDHDFTPHITLAYIDTSEPMPVKEVPMLSLKLDTVSLVIGEKQYDFSLTGDSFDSDDTLTAIPAIKQQKQESDPSPSQIWQPPDIEQRLALLKSKGVATKEWVGDASMCSPICARNHGQVVKVDEAFESGHYDTPGHPHCGCSTIYRNADGNEVDVPDSYGSDYQ